MIGTRLSTLIYVATRFHIEVSPPDTDTCSLSQIIISFNMLVSVSVLHRHDTI